MRIIQTDPPNQFLAGLDPRDFESIASQLRPFALKQRATLQEQGAAIENVYFPLNGIVSLVTVMSCGDTVEIAVVGREGVVGLLAGLGRRPAFARAIVQAPGIAMCMPATQFQEAALRNEPLRQLALRHNENLLGQVAQTAACNALHSLEARLARWLLQMDDRADGAPMLLTQDLMSQMLGARRTTVTLLAGKLHENGLIQYRRGRIAILDRRGLEATACECYRTIRGRNDAVFTTPIVPAALLAR
jgi:CRP-like cAMP-binding protein